MAWRLGEWQFHRLADRQERNEIIERNEKAGADPVADVLAPGRPVVAADEWRIVEATGTYATEDTPLVFPAGDLTANDTDPETNALTVTAVATTATTRAHICPTRSAIPARVRAPPMMRTATRFTLNLSEDTRVSVFYNNRVDRPGEPELRVFPKYDDPENQAVEWYHERLLHSPDGAKARGYLRSRGYDGEIVRKYKLGWAPDDWDLLSRHLDLPDKVLVDTGLEAPSGIEAKGEHRFDVFLIDQAISHAGDAAFGETEPFAGLRVRLLHRGDAIPGQAESVAIVEGDSRGCRHIDSGSRSTLGLVAFFTHGR